MHISRFLLAAGLSLVVSPLWAQTSTVPTPQIVVSGTAVNVGAGVATNNARLQLRDGTAAVDDESVKGNNPVSVTVQGDPGAYTFQFTQNDKLRTPIGAPTQIIVPGVRRDFGVWLFNGSLLVPRAEASTFVAAPPKFLPNLKRDSKAKLPQSTATSVLLEWATIPVDGNELHSKGAAYVLPLLPQKAPRSGFYVGYELNNANDVTVEDITRLRTLIEAQSAGAALILSVNAYEPFGKGASTLNVLASTCDAVKIDTTKDSPTTVNFKQQLWAVKVARRVAEDNANFDIPIFVSQFDEFGEFSPSQALELFQSGATGIITLPNQTAGLAPVEALWRRNANWLAGAVTLEDAAILPDPANKSLAFLDKLRAASRIPLLGRLPLTSKGRPEPLLTIIDDQSDEVKLNGIKSAAEGGQTIYVEGIPAESLWKLWGDTTKSQISALPQPKSEQLRLDDIWLFGALNGTEYSVTQRIKIEFKPDLAAQANEKKGEARETKTRPAAALSADPNGLLVCPVGKGRILWAPHDWSLSGDKNDSRPKAPYYAAIAGAMQPSLVDLKFTDGQTIEGKSVRMALRLSTGKTSLFAVFNDGNQNADLTAIVRDNAKYVYDLKNDKEVASDMRGYGTKIALSVPAHDFAYFALYDTKEAFDKERKIPRLKAKFK